MIAWFLWLIFRIPTIQIYNKYSSALVQVNYRSDGRPWCWIPSGFQESILENGRLSMNWGSYTHWEPYVGRVKFPEAA